MKQLFFFLFVTAFFVSCGSKVELSEKDVVGLWKIELDIESDEKKIPFFLEIISSGSALKAAFWNGEEKIVHNDVQLINDSIFLSNPYYNSTLKLGFNKNKVSGLWTDFSRENYTIAVKGKYNLSHRFKFSEPLSDSVDGRWEVWFGDSSQYKAIGLFNTDENSLKGTFLTETGDYRFLEGGFAGKKLQMSTFDGAHAFLFDATLKNDTIKGWFYSGNHFKEPFIAWRNDTATLSSPYHLTELLNPNEPITFSFRNTNGEVVSSKDSVYSGKPMIVQLMASWCPNCKDQSQYLSSIQDSLKSKNIELIALSFERLDYINALPALKKIKNSLDINYPILYAGSAKKSVAVKSIPWLKQLKSYPTLLYVLPNRKVYRIHTGFYGPGTGSYYEEQIRRLEDDIRNLVLLSK